MKAHSQYLDLTPLMHISLERNSSMEQLIVFKRVAMNRLYEIAVEINRIYPALTIQKAFSYLTLSFAATTNYWAASTENDALKEIYGMPEFEQLKPNFEADMTTAIEVILRGLGIPQQHDNQQK